MKARIIDCTVSSLESYNNSSPIKNLTSEEFSALTSLSRTIGLVIQKSDKGNSVVLVDRNVYVERIENLLSDTCKFSKVDYDKDKELNFVLNQETIVRDTLKELFDKKSISESLYTKLCPPKLGVLYGLAKVHKPCVNGCPPFRPILSAINTPAYKLAKFLVPILAPLTVELY